MTIINVQEFDVAEFTEWWLRQPGEPCVVCGVKTRNVYVNAYTGCIDHVHDPDDPQSIGCKYVWRERVSRAGMVTREQWLSDNYYDIEYGHIDPQNHSDDEFLDERDFYHDYHSYISSREWGTKAYYTKIAAGLQCERCGRIGNQTTLHLHHKHYRTLYHERRQDVEVLCETCHENHHAAKKRK